MFTMFMPADNSTPQSENCVGDVHAVARVLLPMVMSICGCIEPTTLDEYHLHTKKLILSGLYIAVALGPLSEHTYQIVI